MRVLNTTMIDDDVSLSVTLYLPYTSLHPVSAGCTLTSNLVTMKLGAVPTMSVVMSVGGDLSQILVRSRHA